jgi:hypothetical protein
VSKIKLEIKEAEKELAATHNMDDDFNEFVNFSLDYVDDLNANWWDLTPDRRERCKQLTFPGGIFITKNKTVSTPLISEIYRYENIKKELAGTIKSVNGERKLDRLEPAQEGARRFWRLIQPSVFARNINRSKKPAGVKVSDSKVSGTATTLPTVLASSSSPS